MKKYVIYSMTVAFALAAVFVSCEKDKDKSTPVTGVTLNMASVTLAPTDTVTLIAIVQPDNATNKAVTWSSSNPSVAIVNNGLVTAITEGTAVITVTTDDGKKAANCVINVKYVPVASVELNGTSVTLAQTDSITLIATVHPDNATNKAVTWSSSNPDVVAVNSAGLVTAKAGGTASITVTTIDGNKTATCAVDVYKYAQGESVVINGVRWTTRNVDMPGTFAKNLEDAGMFYQWNRKVGWSSTDPMINSNGGTTWDDYSYPIGDTWEKANDPSPAGYRAPTKEELQSLANTTYVTHVWTNINGISGYRCTDKATGASIFLPAVGYRSNNYGSLLSAGSNGYYWSSTSYGTISAYGLLFHSNSFYVRDIDRGEGRSIRCVADQ